MTDDATVLVVDDLPQNLRLLDAVLAPRGFTVVGASSGEEALAFVTEQGPRHRAARHRDARPGRLRGLPAAPAGSEDGVPAGRDDHGQRRPGEGRRDRGRCRRLRHQAVRPGRAAWRGSARWCGSSGTTTRWSGRSWSSRAGTTSSSSGSRPRWRSSTGSTGCGASSRPSWWTSSSTRATSRSWRAIAGRSSSSSATSGASPRSPRPLNPRRS